MLAVLLVYQVHGDAFEGGENVPTFGTFERVSHGTTPTLKSDATPQITNTAVLLIARVDRINARIATTDNVAIPIRLTTVPKTVWYLIFLVMQNKIRMATEIDIPGTEESVDPMDPAGTVKTLITTILGFGLAAMAASLGIALWNRVSETSDQFDEIEVI